MSGSLSFVSQTHRHKNAYTYSPTHTNRINILTGKSFHSANEMTTHRISTLSHALQSHAITQMSLLSIAHKSTLDFAQRAQAYTLKFPACIEYLLTQNNKCINTGLDPSILKTLDLRACANTHTHVNFKNKHTLALS